MSNWGWILLAWGQLVVFYVGYLLYLNWRLGNLKDDQ